MVNLTGSGEGESYVDIARMVTADLGSTALPSVVELKFGYASDAGDFLANPRHLDILNSIFRDQVPPIKIVEASFGAENSFVGTTLALTIDNLQ